MIYTYVVVAAIYRNADGTKTTEKSEAAMRLAEFCFFVNIDCSLFDQWAPSDLTQPETQLAHLLSAFGVCVNVYVFCFILFLYRTSAGQFCR